MPTPVKLHDLSDTWADSETTYKALAFDVTDTASAADSLLQEFSVGEEQKWAVRKDGSIVVNGLRIRNNEGALEVSSDDGSTWELIGNGAMVDTVDSLCSLDSAINGGIYHTRGRTNAGDGFGGFYRYVSGSSATCDGGFTLDGIGGDNSDGDSAATYAGTGTGRFIALNQSITTAKAFGAAGDGETDDTYRLKAAVDSGATVRVTSGTYLVEGTLSCGASTSIRMDGGIIDCTGDSSAVTISGGFSVVGFHRQAFIVDAGTTSTTKIKIRSAADSDNVNPNIDRLSPIWFNGADMGVQIQKSLACGSDYAVHTCPPGVFDLTKVSFDQDYYGMKNTIEGASHIGTTLVMEASSASVGFDMWNCRETTVRNLRIIEDSGGVTGCCISMGGTSLVIEHCWFGNSKYGMVNRGTNGAHTHDVFVENCHYGALISSNFADYDVDGLDVAGDGYAGTSVLNCRYSQVYFHSNGNNNAIGPSGLRITSHAHIEFTGITGSFQVGETVTGGTSGATFVVASSNDTNAVSLESDVSGTFTDSETLTGGTSGATATFADITNNQTKAISFVNLAVSGNDRYGAYIDHALSITLQGVFRDNGTEGSIGAGILIDDEADVALTGSIVKDNDNSTGTNARGVWVAGGTLSIANTLFGNDAISSPTQDYDIYRTSGTVRATGCVFDGTADNSGTITFANCIGALDNHRLSGSADPTSTEIPNNGDHAIFKNTTSGDVFLAYNDSDTIKKITLS